MRKFKIIVIIIIIFFSNFVVAQTNGFVNNGLIINIESGAYINVGDFTNNQTSGTDGSINIDGNLIVNGNFANNSGGNVFSNIEPVPDGNIILAGFNQSILGTTPIFFENLEIQNALKTLSLNNCEVKGIFTVDGVLELNSNKLIIDNKNTDAISYNSGYIKSESTPQDGLGEIEWKIGNTIGSFDVPFGSGSGSNDLNLVLNTKTAADPQDGSVVFATYPTDGHNKPYPDGILSLDTLEPKNLADRYWELKPVFTTKPDVTISFKYTPEDIDATDNPDLIEANLMAIRYNDLLYKWIDMRMTGICDVANKTVTTGDISGNNFFSYWDLSEFELKAPNAFTPDDNGKNDVFLKGYEVKIFNRWDEKIYEGKDGWDGTYNGKKVSRGTYYYIAVIPSYNNTTKTITGVITLVSK